MKAIPVCCLLALVASLASADDFSFAFEGDAAKRTRLKDLQGASSPPALHLSEWTNSDAMSLADLKGKIVVLDFWATWCGPCIRSIPHMNEMKQEFAEDVVFIGVCHPRGRVEEVLKRLLAK